MRKRPGDSFCLAMSVPWEGHRVTDWFGVEGTIRGHLGQLPALSRDICSHTRVLRALPSLEWFQGGTCATCQAASQAGRARGEHHIYLL